MKTKLTLFIAVIAVALFGTGCASSSLNKGLVAYYPFNGNAKDESGNGNDGEVMGAALSIDRHGTINSSYGFDGKKDYIEVKNAADLNGFDSMTISFWVKIPSQVNRGAVISKWWFKAEGDLYAIWVDEKNRILTGTNRYLNDNGNISDPLTADHWHFVTFIHDYLKGGILYLNGEYTGNVPSKGSIASYNNDLRIGVCNDTGSLHRYFKGMIDDIRIYNRAISNAEVKVLYDLEKPKTK